MRSALISSARMEAGSRRLDARPYLSAARRASEGATQALAELTLGGLEGIYHAGRESRRWVESPDHGVPFLQSAKLQAADLSGLPLLAREQLRANPKLVLHAGTTLITRTGTIGRMAYARPDMAGLACSEHVMRVRPDPAKIPPGYLYAYLSSEWGTEQVRAGTYGSIIRSIEPQHLAGLGVPRLGELEARVHASIDAAARRRSQAARVRAELLAEITERLQWRGIAHAGVSASVGASQLRRRMDAAHHAELSGAARACLARAPGRRLGELVQEVFEPGRGARERVEDARLGVPFLSSSAVFRIEPTGEYAISRTRTPRLERLLVTERDVLVPRSGQRGGVIARAVLPLPNYYACAASEHLVRVRCERREDACYLWALLATQPGYHAILATAHGSSIPSLDCSLLADLRVPWWEASLRASIVARVEAMVAGLAAAIEAERRGLALVEAALATEPQRVGQNKF